jgi:hypothetical protein
VVGWLRPQKLDLQVAVIKQNTNFKTDIANYSELITINPHFYFEDYVGKLDQFTAYDIVREMDIKEKFIFIFYNGGPDDVYYTTFYLPERNSCITTCPANDPRLLTFELAHQLQKFYNSNRGNNPYIEVVDSMGPTEEMITSKIRSIEPYLHIFT